MALFQLLSVLVVLEDKVRSSGSATVDSSSLG